MGRTSIRICCISMGCHQEYRRMKAAFWAAIVGAFVPSVGAQLSEAQMKYLESKLPVAATEKVDFERQVWPILDNRCIRCHGPERPKSKFRIDSKENALKGGELQRNDIEPG